MVGKGKDVAGWDSDIERMVALGAFTIGWLGAIGRGVDVRTLGELVIGVHSCAIES